MAGSGRIVFGPIPRLQDQWWDFDDEISVWSTWDPNTYYLWGANAQNWDRTIRATIIGGGGMAGPDIGPTTGRGHEHYLGVNTMSYDTGLAAHIFAGLTSLLTAGHDILVPTYNDRYSLGTGIAANQPAWQQIQLDILERLDAVQELASDWVAPPGTYWPDCRQKFPDGRSICEDQKMTGQSSGTYPLVAPTDLATIIAALS